MTNVKPHASRTRTRRLSDKLRLVFHTACNEAELSLAEQCLNQLYKSSATLAVEPSGHDRRSPEDLNAVSERLANLLLWRSEAHAEPEAEEDAGRVSQPPRGTRPN